MTTVTSTECVGKKKKRKERRNQNTWDVVWVGAWAQPGSQLHLGFNAGTSRSSNAMVVPDYRPVCHEPRSADCRDIMPEYSPRAE